MLLGDYVGESPASLCFRTGTYGKPELQGDAEEPPIHFNLSHSEDVALYGITRACPVGVDVECARTFPDYERVGRRFFSRAECMSLEAIRKEDRGKRFFELWTRKEALLKVTGEGLGDRQAGCGDFVLEPGAPGCTNLPQTADASGVWRVRSFSPLEGYVAAVAFGKANVNFIFRAVSAATFLEIKAGSEHQQFNPDLCGTRRCRALKS